MMTSPPRSTERRPQPPSLCAVSGRPGREARGGPPPPDPGLVPAPTAIARARDTDLAQNHLERAEFRPAALEKIQAHERREPEEETADEKRASGNRQKKRKKHNRSGKDTNEAFGSHINLPDEDRRYTRCYEGASPARLRPLWPR